MENVGTGVAESVADGQSENFCGLGLLARRQQRVQIRYAWEKFKFELAAPGDPLCNMSCHASTKLRWLH